MSNKIKIAVDAMSGENSPKKIIEGINISLKFNKNNFFSLYGRQEILEKEIARNKSIEQYCEIINTKNIIEDEESPLVAAKTGRDSSMWKAPGLASQFRKVRVRDLRFIGSLTFQAIL